MTTLYLASTSPARLALLRAAGIEPVALPSSVDEDAAVARAESERDAPLSPSEMVLLLAKAKAEAVAGGAAADLDGFVLGGDSAFELDGVVYGKPHTVEVARERWHRQRGRTGTLFSGHWLIDNRTDAPARGAGVGHVASATVSFVPDLGDDEIEAYLRSGEPLEVAGAFTIDSLGGPFIDRIDGDPSTVIGLSLPTLRRLLGSFGLPMHQLWNRAGLVEGAY
ncbi:Maf family protein [Amnibacterium flavum]|uniref:Nucleoside triphosphate pyrophosphatase n=1 Tax=Amnibacterium flavum TaxID=2173173 RepID=A0A2V1HX55_9MICO|nr:nucleoside triphosphate pyrophosphatase [Amnibacterium flavum]PVZ95830.1 septum formation inhibitor Maf [Amnibacterium flavum]